MKLQEYRDRYVDFVRHACERGIGYADRVNAEILAKQIETAAWKPELRAEAKAIAAQFRRATFAWDQQCGDDTQRISAEAAAELMLDSIAAD